MIRTLKLLSIGGVLSIGLYAQSAPVQSIPLVAPPPPPVQQMGASIIGNSGPRSFTYFIVATYPIGNVVSQALFVTGAPNTLSSANYVAVSWNAPASGISSYDVVRYDGQVISPTNCSNCLVVSGATSTTLNDQTPTLAGSYSYTNLAGQAIGSILLNNKDFAVPTLQTVPAIQAGASTSIIATGIADFTNATHFFPRALAADPATCTVNEQYYNTVSQTTRWCTALNTWSDSSTLFTQIGANAVSRTMLATVRELSITPTDYSGASPLIQANNADTQGLGVGTSGVQYWPVGFGPSVDFFLNAGSLWSDRHCVLDYRGGNFSSIPANTVAPFGIDCLRTTDPSSGTSHEAGLNFRTYWMAGGANPNITGKSDLENVQFNMYAGGTTIGQHYGIGLYDTKVTQGDMTSIFTFTKYMGNCNEQGGECAESIRSEVTNDAPMTGTVNTYNNVSGLLVPSASTNYWNNGIGRLAIKNPASPLYNTGTIASVSGTGTITVVGAGTLWNTLTAGAHTDLCFSPADLDNSSQKWVLPITSITDDTHLVLTYKVNSVNQKMPGLVTTTGVYRIYNCSQVLSVVQPLSTGLAGFTLDTTTYNGWANGDNFEVPQGYQFRAELYHGTLSVTMPYSSGFPTALLRMGTETGKRPPGVGIWLVGPTTRTLFFDTLPTDDNNLSSTGVLVVPSSSTAIGPLIRVLPDSGGVNSTIDLIEQPAAVSGTKVSLIPSTNGFCVGTTASGCFWTAFSNTGKVATSGDQDFLGSNNVQWQFTASGTVTTNLLVKTEATAYKATATLTTDTDAYGVALATVTNAVVQIARYGQVPIVTDGANTIGNLAGISGTVQGNVHDLGVTLLTVVPQGTRVIGRFKSASGGAGNTAIVDLTPYSWGTASTTPYNCNAYTINFNETTLAGTGAVSADVTLLGVAAHTLINSVRVKSQSQFTGTALTSLTVSVGAPVGTSCWNGQAASTFYAGAYDLFAAASNTNIEMDGGNSQCTDAAHNVTAHFIANAGAVLSGLTAGSADFEVCYHVIGTPTVIP